MAKVLSSYRFVSVVFVVVVLVNVQFRFAVLPAIFVSYIRFSFFSPLFFLATFISKRRGNFFRLFLLSFSDFSIANFKQCWVISPYYSHFPSFYNSHHQSFPLPSPKPLPVLPPPPLFSRALVPDLRPLNSSFFFAPLYRKCLVIPFLLRRFI